MFDDKCPKTTENISEKVPAKKSNKRKAQTSTKRRNTTEFKRVKTNTTDFNKTVYRMNRVSDNESTVSHEDEQLVPQGPNSVQHFPPKSGTSDQFAFSDLMREMAKKYQRKEDEER